MKHLLLILLLAAVAYSQEATPPASPQDSGSNNPATQSIPVDQENARKARAVIDQGVKALGGDAFLNFTDLSSEGRRYSFHRGQPNSLGTLFWRFQKYPDKDRVEFTKKRDVLRIYNGDKGYEVTYKGVRNLEMKDDLEPYLRRRHYALVIVLRDWLKQPGVALFYEGRTVAAQKQSDQVTIMNAKNEAVTLFFDIETHLPVQKRFTWRDPTDKERNVEEEVFDNYRPIQGIMTPFDDTTFFNGDMSGQLFLTSAAYNQSLSDSLFDPNQASISGNKKH
jgi:hypothetical protein